MVLVKKEVIMRKINNEGIEYLKKWEGLKLSAYKDDAGVLTIGYGHTGPDVTEGQIITEAEAEELLIKDLDRFERAVNNTINVRLTANQFTTLVSFAFNVGDQAFKDSTLVKRLNKGDYASVPQELLRWNISGGKINNGLINRRAAEIGLWAKGSYVAPQTKCCKQDPSKKYENTAMMATGAGGIGALLNEMASYLHLYALNFVVIKYVFIGLTLTGLAFTLWSKLNKLKA